MIAFLIGGEGRFMDAMINKLNKDGHRVYLPVSYTHLDVYKRQQH